MFKKLIILLGILALWFLFIGRSIASASDFFHYESQRLIRDNNPNDKVDILEKVREAGEEGLLGEHSDTIIANIEEWLQEEYGDSWKQIRELVEEENWKELADSFYKDLEFGTAGIRGLMGVGPNRINEYTIMLAAYGTAQVLLSEGVSLDTPFIVAYDTRDKSDEFAKVVASVLAAYGIKVELTDSDKPVGWFSFAITDRHALGGIMVTASHNPVGYNGVKVSWAHGGQVLPKRGIAISEKAKEVKIKDIKSMNFEQAEREGIISYLPTETHRNYIDNILNLALDGSLTHEDRAKIHIVYDPLYGTNREIVPELLELAGYENVEIVEEHAVKDPNFTGLIAPNPTAPGVLSLATAKATELANRLGQAVGAEDWVMLTGNETWAGLVDYYLARLEAKQNLPENGVIVKSWVTTSIIKEIARNYGIRSKDTPVGFKWIGALMTQADIDVIAGFEESNGMSLGRHTREKDGALALLLYLEAITYWNKIGANEDVVIMLSNDSDGDRLVVNTLKGSVIMDKLDELYKNFGYYKNVMDDSLRFEGPEGMAERDTILDSLVESPPSEIDGIKIKNVQISIGGVKDGIRFKLEDGSLITIRKSGTEPVLRIYVEVSGETAQKSEEKLQEVLEAIKEYIQP